MFTDTVSLTYDDLYEDFHKDKYKFDLSKYPKNSKFYDETNKNVIGKMKDETKGVLLVVFVRVKSKMHSFIKEDDIGDKKGKGINENQ